MITNPAITTSLVVVSTFCTLAVRPTPRQFSAVNAAISADAVITGKLDVNLRGSRPNYRLTAKVKGMKWQSGKVDADSTLETFGTGMQLLTNATGEGIFSGPAIDLETPPPLRSVAGVYSFSWWQAGPRL